MIENIFHRNEVLIISITTAILLNFMLTQRLLNAITVAKDAMLPVKNIIKYFNIMKFKNIDFK